MVIGPRIWKTGIAVALSIILVDVFNLTTPLLAIVAAIFTIQPSITKSLNHGSKRVVSTFIGGIIGFIAVSYFGSHPLTVGLAVIIAIAIAIKLKLQEGIAMTAITVTAVMLDVTGDPKFYALDRLVETLIGIGVGVGVNLVFSPPKSEEMIIKDLNDLSQDIKSIYVTALNSFTNDTEYDQEELEKDIQATRKKLDETRGKIFELKDEIGYKNNLKEKQIKKYKVVITSFNLIFDRILGIYQTGINRSQRNINKDGISDEYREILDTLQSLLTVNVSIQENIISYLNTKNIGLCNYLETCSQQNSKLVKDLRKQINNWHLKDENKNKALSLMEISNIGYEMEQISQHLQQINKTLIDFDEEKG